MPQPSTDDEHDEFKPHKGATLNTPMLHMILEPLLPFLQPFLTALYRLRWALTRPMEIRLLPNWFPLLPGLKNLPYVNFGELLMIAPLIILLFAGYSYTFVAVDVASSGTVASYALYAVFLSANKSNSLFTFLLGIPFERMIPYHRLASVVAITLGAFHCYGAFHVDTVPNLPDFLVSDDTNLTGTLLLAFMIGLVALSLLPILRRNFFNVWLWTHVSLAIGTLVFCFLHNVSSIIFVAIWWAVDVMMRYLVQAKCRLHAKDATIRLLQHDLVEITFSKPKGFHYNPGQFVQIAIPKISVLEFHPVSISTAPHEENVTFIMRALGDWTKKLVALADESSAGLDILIEGPYGSVSVDMDNDDRFKMFLLVSGGIGVTHCQSIGKALVHQATVGRDLKALKFVWAVRNLDMVDDIPPLGGANGRCVATDNDGAPNERSGVERPRPKRQVIQTDVYVTSAGAAYDPEAPRNYNVREGRPDLDAIFLDMKKQAQLQGEHSIAVFGCGPAPLMDSLREACRKHSQSVVGCGGVFFDLHMEIFEF